MANLPSLLFSPVVIETVDVGRLRTVSSVGEAAECLLSHWPEVSKEDAYRAAALAAYDAERSSIDR